MKTEISSELLKGSLKSIVLKLLSENDKMYGYEITQMIDNLSNGKIKLTYGALYPILHKLENDGSVLTETEIVNNRTRVYYKLTKTGFSTAEEKVNELEEFINTIKILLNPNPALQVCRS
ncbi:MAG: PadR family transcriptional regulator [Bacteroidales bacterium]|nr:PadR family transcriptional regulator [Bacteroidales bacterium]